MVSITLMFKSHRFIKPLQYIYCSHISSLLDAGGLGAVCYSWPKVNFPSLPHHINAPRGKRPVCCIEKSSTAPKFVLILRLTLKLGFSVFFSASSFHLSSYLLLSPCNLSTYSFALHLFNPSPLNASQKRRRRKCTTCLTERSKWSTRNWIRGQKILLTICLV